VKNEDGDQNAQRLCSCPMLLQQLCRISVSRQIFFGLILPANLLTLYNFLFFGVIFEREINQDDVIDVIF